MHPLERMRRAAAYSLRDLAELAEVPKASIVDIEKGRTRTPHPRTLRKLAGVLDCDPQELMPREEVTVG